MKTLELAPFPGPIIFAPGDTLLVPVPSDERPLRGDAGWVDWRVCGGISQQLLSGYVSGARREVVLLGAERPLASRRILLVGLGPSRSLQARVVQRAFCTAGERLLGLRSRLAALALPGALDLEIDAEPLVRGCVQALSSARGGARLRIGIPGGEERTRALEAALSAATRDAQRRRVRLEMSPLEAEPGPPATPPAHKVRSQAIR